MIEMKNDYVLIRTDKEEERSGSIILVDSAKKRPQTGVIVAALEWGLMPTNEKPTVKERINVKERVLFFDNVGRTINYEGEDLLVMKASEILGVIR